MATKDDRTLGSRCFHIKPDTPKSGVTFFDMTPLLAEADLRVECGARFVEALALAGIKPTCVFAIETRGYFVGTWIADMLNLPLVPVRKLAQARRVVKNDGELFVSEPYSTEYAEASDASRLCVQRDVLESVDVERVLVVDDVVATGGSMHAASLVAAAIDVMARCHVVGYAALLQVLACTYSAPPLKAPMIVLFQATDSSEPRILDTGVDIERSKLYDTTALRVSSGPDLRVCDACTRLMPSAECEPCATCAADHKRAIFDYENERRSVIAAANGESFESI